MCELFESLFHEMNERAIASRMQPPPRLRKRSTSTHCANGHEWNARTRYQTPGGHLACRACRSGSAKRWYYRQTAARFAASLLGGVGAGAN